MDVDKATHDVLIENCNKLLNIHDMVEDAVSDMDTYLARFVIENSYRNDEGRLVVPALWNSSVLHRLPNNYKLATKVLESVYKKLKADPVKLLQYDNEIKNQIENGIMVRVGNFKELINDINVSFLPHNGVFRPSNETTKCRIVNLSNLCDKSSPNNLSLNQVSLPGPQVNNELFVSLTLYRFNRYLMIYDLQKAFLQLCLREEDTFRFLFLWYKDVTNNNKELICLKQQRVPFGTRFPRFY